MADEDVRSRSAAIDEYIEIRFRDQLDWYERMAYRARRRHLVFQLVQMVLLVSVPLLLIFSEFLGYPNRPLLLSAIVASIGAASLTMYSQVARLDTWWQQYRLLSEQLRHEHFNFSMGMGEYSDLDREKGQRVFVQRVESLISREKSKWFVVQEVS